MTILSWTVWIGLTKIGFKLREAMKYASSVSDSELEEAFPLETSMGGPDMVFKGAGYSESKMYANCL